MAKTPKLPDKITNRENPKMEDLGKKLALFAVLALAVIYIISSTPSLLTRAMSV
jgi:hypothetical protein